MNIYVGNLSFSMTDMDLEELFSQFGPVKSVKIIIDRDTSRSRGFGFVEMEETADGEDAIQSLNGTQVAGRVLTVNQARPRPPRNSYR